MNDYNVIYLGLSDLVGNDADGRLYILTTYDFAAKPSFPSVQMKAVDWGKRTRYQRLCPKQKVLGGLEIKGSAVNEAASETKVLELDQILEIELRSDW